MFHYFSPYFKKAFFSVFRDCNTQEIFSLAFPVYGPYFECPLYIYVVSFTKGNRINLKSCVSWMEFWNQVYREMLDRILPQVLLWFNHIHRKQYWFLRAACNKFRYCKPKQHYCATNEYTNIKYCMDMLRVTPKF